MDKFGSRQPMGKTDSKSLNFCFRQTLEEKLPAGHPPSEGSEPEYTRWREELQRALVETFCDCSEDFACKGQLAGTTVTVVLQVPPKLLKHVGIQPRTLACFTPILKGWLDVIQHRVRLGEGVLRGIRHKLSRFPGYPLPPELSGLAYAFAERSNGMPKKS